MPKTKIGKCSNTYRSYVLLTQLKCTNVLTKQPQMYEEKQYIRHPFE